MASVSPVVPEYITVHLGGPNSNASNVTVAFPDYIKNVVSSEIYPTWEEAALRANTYAIVSFALNRVYTEYYLSRGKAFQITSSTGIDQKYIHGRNIFANVSRIVDELYDDYIRRQGFIEPLAAKFCNGTTVTCAGLSQWGSQGLAEAGYGSLAILRTYYGNNIELVVDAPVGTPVESYPGVLRRGDRGYQVEVLQTMINRISQSYPAIPKLNADGIFGANTEAAVKKYQQIFNLTQDGIVGRATWYSMARLYVGLLRLSELNSLGQTLYGISWQYPDAISRGDRGPKVEHMQYMLAVIGEFYDAVPPLTPDGIYGELTYEAVVAFQRMTGLKADGIVGPMTWDMMYSFYLGVVAEVLSDADGFPTAGARSEAAPAAAGVSESGRRRGGATAEPADIYARSSRMTQYPGFYLKQGTRDMEVKQ
ncbi:MAG: peptidoglycan-binding protein [Clostridia bacterium]|nr:peptidoglycan-binding protein [Clostridia bacterium]